MEYLETRNDKCDSFYSLVCSFPFTNEFFFLFFPPVLANYHMQNSYSFDFLIFGEQPGRCTLVAKRKQTYTNCQPVYTSYCHKVFSKIANVVTKTHNESVALARILIFLLHYIYYECYNFFLL